MEKKRKNLGGYGYDADFPKRLRALMENENSISPLERKVSQAELAKAIGVTRQAISTYSLGTSVPDIIKFKAIADFFHVNYDYLIGTSNVLNEKQRGFVEMSRLPPSTLNAILKICSSDDHWIAFMLLVETAQFYDIINALASNLRLINDNEEWTDQDALLAINERVQRETHGALCVTPVRLERDRHIFNAQRYLATAMEAIDIRLRDLAKEADVAKDS